MNLHKLIGTIHNIDFAGKQELMLTFFEACDSWFAEGVHIVQPDCVVSLRINDSEQGTYSLMFSHVESVGCYRKLVFFLNRDGSPRDYVFKRLT